MDDHHKQHLIDLPKVIAGGIATPSATLLTSRFGVAGTMIGLAVSAVTVTIIADVLKVYLARVPGAVTSIPGGFKKKSLWGRFLLRLRLPFSKLSSLAPAQRRSILIRSVIAGGIMFVIGLVIVTGVELSVGKNLSCWVWDNCYTESSADGENASDAGNLPSIFIAGNSVRTSASQVGPSLSQQQPAAPLPPTPSSGNGAQPSVSQQPSTPPTEQQSQSTEYQQRSEEYQQQGEYQQQSEYRQQDEYQQQSPTSSLESPPQSSSTYSETEQPSDYQQQSPPPSEGADGL